MKFAYEDLLVWQEATALVKKIYQTTRRFPKSEMFGLTSQLQRAATSIALNIAEGKGRYSKKEFQHFLYLARGSLYETATILQVCMDLELLEQSHYDDLREVCKSILSKLSGLINSIK